MTTEPLPSPGGWQRHTLVCLSDAAWRAVHALGWEAPARQCLVYWAAHGLPLVVTRKARGRATQADGRPAAVDTDLGARLESNRDRDHDGDLDPARESGLVLDLGLPAPACWARQRIALQLPASAVARTMAFPGMADVRPLLAPAVAAAWSRLQERLAAPGLRAQVYGSHGWQTLSALAYLHPDSDLDLLVHVADAGAADHAAAVLAHCGIDQPRLDGELVFADGSACAWREWQRWRRGDARHILVKRRTEAVLEPDERWLQAAARPMEAVA